MNKANNILDLLDWNNSPEQQAMGIRLARDYESIRIFLQPCTQRHNKNVWDNCALIISERTDEELRPFLPELLDWLQDLNWPGALCIRERLIEFSDKAVLNREIVSCTRRAQAQNDEVWLKTLDELG